MTGRNRAAFRGACLAVACAAGAAQAQVDPSGTWRTWTTDHFRIHARANLAPAALRLAAEAERAYRLLGAELRPPRGRIDVTLLDNVDFSNGFANVFPSNRIVLYLSAPATDVSLGAYDDWLRLVTLHELVHVFHLDRAEGVWRVLRAVFGRNPALFPNAYQPSWVSEGLATYYESRYTTAGRLRGGFHAQLLAAGGRGRWPGPNDITFGSPVWPGGLGPYAWGSYFFQTLADTYGDSIVPGFVERSSRQWWPIALSAPLRGAGAAGVGPGWDALRQRWARDAPPPYDRVVARTLRSPPRVRVAPDGRRAAFVRRDERRDARVVVVDLATGRDLASHRVTGGVDLAWQGDTVLVTQLGFVSPVEIRSDFYRWVPGRSWERVTRGGRVETPSPLPDGGVVLIAGVGGVQRPIRCGGGVCAPYPVPPGDDWGRIAVSPDGRWMAAARHAHGRWDIVRWPMDRPQDAAAVTDDAARDADPAWSPDGSRVLFASERDGIPQIHAYSMGDGGTVRLTDTPTGASEPHLTRDGTLIYSTVLSDGHAVVAQRTLLDVPGAARVMPPPPPPPPPAAPATAAVEGAYNPWPALVPRYWIPTAHSEGPAGRFFGAQSGSNDPIGRFSYGVVATVAPAQGRWEWIAAARYSRWHRVALDARAGQTWEFAGRALTTDGDTVPLAVRERAVSGGVTWRWRRWRSAASVRVGGEIEHDALAVDGPAGFGTPGAGTTFAGMVITVSAAHVHRPALSISPEDGLSASVLYRRRTVLGGPEWSDEWRGSVSGYVALPLPGFAHWVLAARIRGGRTGGDLPATFALGGESSETFEVIPGIDIGGARRTFPLRGYPGDRARFTRVATGAVELRIPVAAVARGFWNLPLALDRVSATAFAETGGGWMAGEPATPTALRDLGAEIVFDLVLGYDTPVRMRGGLAAPLTSGLGVARGDVRGYVSVGGSF